MTYQAIDCFSGAGGLSLGLVRAGFNVKVAVELDKHAAETFRANHPDTHVFEKDICEVDAKDILKHCEGSVALLAGCAPCQGFCSLTAKHRTHDPRNTLLLRMGELIRDIRPEAVMMENVPGLETRGKRIFRKFLKLLEDHGYHVRLKDGTPAWRVVQMADYGVPQSRRRLVLLAGNGFDIPFPEPTHAKNPKKGSSRKPWLTLGDVIKGERKPLTLSESWKTGGPRKHRWHIVRDLQPQVAARLKAAVPGKTWKDVVDESVRPKCHRGKYDGFTNVYGRMTWDQIPVTMTGGCTTASKGRFGHPNKSRTTISVREAALIQTFPRSYRFATDYMDKVCDMIGNAVPPRFAEIAAKHIFHALRLRKSWIDGKDFRRSR